MRVTISFQIQGQVLWNAIKGPSGMWIAACDSLKLAVQGETWGEMQEAANEAIEMLLSDLYESGELQEFLRRHGWIPTIPLPQDPSSEVAFDVPMFFQVTDGAHGSTRAVP